MLGVDLDQFVAEYNNLTDLQKKDFISQSTGKWVSWSGIVSDVISNGTVIVTIPDTLLSTVWVQGIQHSDASKLSKGETINFIGQISSVVDFMGLHI